MSNLFSVKENSLGFGNRVKLGLIEGYSGGTKFGRNPNIAVGGTGTANQDIWAEQGTYTGFNATAGQNIEVFSSSANDEGTLVSSGTGLRVYL